MVNVLIQCAVILSIVATLIGPEIGRLRYTMERNHTNFMTQIRGPGPDEYVSERELWNPYFTD